MRLSIFGAGYVGTVTGACLALDGHDVVLVDIDPAKVTAINNGVSPFHEDGLTDRVRDGVASQKLSATNDGHGAILSTDISLVCVGTPSLEDGRVDMSCLEEVCGTIGAALKDKDRPHAVVFRSTMPPGTVNDRLVPVIEAASGKLCGADFVTGYNPEFLREGNAIADHYAPTQIVAGAEDEPTAGMIMALYDGIDAPRFTLPIKDAEALKYVSNIWRAQKIAFANEMGDILHGWGVDPHKVMDVAFQDRRINLGPAFLKAGFAYGGSCLPKDIRAAAAEAKSRHIKTPVLDAIQMGNMNRIDTALGRVKALGAKTVLILGASFKPHTDDLRESPYVALADKLAALCAVQVFDTNIQKCWEGYWKSNDNIDLDVDVIVLSHDLPVYRDIIDKAPPSVQVLTLTRPQQPIGGGRRVYGLAW